MAERKKREKEMQEESDLMMAAESFGVCDTDTTNNSQGGGAIDGYQVSAASEDFNKFQELLIAKISSFKVNH